MPYVDGMPLQPLPDACFPRASSADGEPEPQPELDGITTVDLDGITVETYGSGFSSPLFDNPREAADWLGRLLPTESEPEPEPQPEPEPEPEHEELPDEVFARIFANLDAVSDLFRVKRVCRQWRDASASPIAWSHPQLGLGIAPWINGMVQRRVVAFERETDLRLLTSAQTTLRRRQLISAFKAWEATVWEPLVAPRDLLEENYSRGERDMQALREARQVMSRGYGARSSWVFPPVMQDSMADDALALLVRQVEAAPSLTNLNLMDTAVTLRGLESAYEACRSDSLKKVVVAKCWGLQRSKGWAALRAKIESHGVYVQIAYIVSIKARGQDGTEVFFKISSHNPLKRLMDVYAQRRGGTPSVYRFIFDGNRIVETQRPIDLMMEDDDVIDAMLEQVGD